MKYITWQFLKWLVICHPCVFAGRAWGQRSSWPPWASGHRTTRAKGESSGLCSVWGSAANSDNHVNSNFTGNVPWGVGFYYYYWWMVVSVHILWTFYKKEYWIWLHNLLLPKKLEFLLSICKALRIFLSFQEAVPSSRNASLLQPEEPPGP